MEPRLTLVTMGTLAGVVIFIELTMELFWKKVLRRLQESPDYGLVLNAIALASGFAGSIMAQAARGEPVHGPAMAEILLRCIEGTSIAIAGYEGVKHSARFARAQLGALKARRRP